MASSENALFNSVVSSSTVAPMAAIGGESGLSMGEARSIIGGDGVAHGLLHPTRGLTRDIGESVGTEAHLMVGLALSGVG